MTDMKEWRIQFMGQLSLSYKCIMTKLDVTKSDVARALRRGNIRLRDNEFGKQAINDSGK